jgi:hypothetical protein
VAAQLPYGLFQRHRRPTFLDPAVDVPGRCVPASDIDSGPTQKAAENPAMNTNLLIPLTSTQTVTIKLLQIHPHNPWPFVQE